MISEALNFAQTRPFTSGLIVIGAGALGYFALRGAPAQTAPASDVSSLYTRPSDAEIAAASNIAINQAQISRASEDAQIAAVLASKSLDYQYDLEKDRVRNATLTIQGQNAVALREQDVAETTAFNDYGLGLAAISSQYNIERDKQVYGTALEALKSNNGLTRDLYLADKDVEKTSIQANTEVAGYQYAYQSAQAQARATVDAAKASKKRGFSFGPFSLSF